MPLLDPRTKVPYLWESGRSGRITTKKTWLASQKGGSIRKSMIKKKKFMSKKDVFWRKCIFFWRELQRERKRPKDLHALKRWCHQNSREVGKKRSLPNWTLLSEKGMLSFLSENSHLDPNSNQRKKLFCRGARPFYLRTMSCGPFNPDYPVSADKVTIPDNEDECR